MLLSHRSLEGFKGRRENLQRKEKKKGQEKLPQKLGEN